jgi:hypothetical protein
MGCTKLIVTRLARTSQAARLQYLEVLTAIIDLTHPQLLAEAGGLPHDAVACWLGLPSAFGARANIAIYNET